MSWTQVRPFQKDKGMVVDLKDIFAILKILSICRLSTALAQVTLLALWPVVSCEENWL